MQQVKKTTDYTIYQKKSGRYAVKGKDKKWVNGEDKQAILLTESLIKLPEPRTAPAEAEAEAEPEAAAEE